MKAMYKKLLKIKNPILIEIAEGWSCYPNDYELNRYRILYPDGRCEYALIDQYDDIFTLSCFCPICPNLEKTVNRMYEYDSNYLLKITRIQEIK